MIASDSDSTNTNIETCIVCGKNLNRPSSNGMCRTCKRGIYATKIIKELEEYNIKAESSFKKTDLDILELPEIKIQDYIWTLQEYNLLREQNNTYYLKDEKTLKEFTSKYEKYVEPSNRPKNTKKQVLNKECSLCKKNKKITEFYKSTTNPDGYDEYCKSCKGLIKTAKYLKYLLNYVKPEEKFKNEDIEQYYENKLDFQGQIWNLQEADLLKTDKDPNYLFLIEERKINEFLNQYDLEKEESPKKIVPKKIEEPNTSKTTIPLNYFISNTNKEYFEITAKENIDNDKLFELLTSLKIFKSTLKRIVTYKINNEKTEVLIELKSEMNNLDSTLKILEEMNWKKIN